MKTAFSALVAPGISLLAFAIATPSSQAQVSSAVEDPAFPAASKAIRIERNRIHRAVDLQQGPDGSFWLAGLLDNESSSKQSPILTKLTSTGDIDTSFGSMGSIRISAAASGMTHTIALQSDGKVIVAYNDGAALRLLRLNRHGIRDETFGAAHGEVSLALTGFSSIKAEPVIVQPDGKILVLARPESTWKRPSCLFRLNTSGTLDSTFGDGGQVWTRVNDSDINRRASISLCPNGDIWVAGIDTNSCEVRTVRLRSNGTHDPAVGNNGVQVVSLAPSFSRLSKVKIDSKGIALVSGEQGQVCMIARVNPDGMRDPSLNVAMSMVPEDFVQSPDGRLFVAGWKPLYYFYGYHFASDGFLACFHADGKADRTFASGSHYLVANREFKGAMRKLLLQDDGSLLVAGNAASSSSNSSYGVTRYLTGPAPVYVPPVISLAPQDTVVNEGTTIALPVKTAANTLAPACLWRKNGNFVAVTSTSLLLRATWSDSGDYTVEARNFAGSDTRSFRLTVKSPPKLVTDLQVNQGTSGTQLRAIVDGRPPFTFQWQRSGADFGQPQISESGDARLNLSAGPANSGEYRVLVSNADGSVTSKTFNYSPPALYPVVTRQPASFEGLIPTTFKELTVEVTGQLPMTFQWQKDGINLGPPQIQRSYAANQPGHVHSALSIRRTGSVLPEDSGAYRCIISNASSWTVTQEALVRIYSRPKIRIAEPRQILRRGDPLRIEWSPFVNSQIRSISWLHNGRNIHGSSALAALLIPSVDLGHAGTYQVVLNTTAGKVESDVCIVAVVDHAGRTAVTAPGKSVSLTAPAAGPGLAFLWRRTDARPLMAPGYSGERSSTLKVHNPGPNEAAAYVCDVTWSAYHGPTVTSGPVTVEFAAVRPELETTSLPQGQIFMRYDCTLRAGNQPARFAVTGLPHGLICDPQTGAISGTPQQSGTFNVRVVASNMFGSSAPALQALNIAPLPSFVAGSYRGFVSDTHTPDMGILQLDFTGTGNVTGKMTFQQPDGPLRAVSINTKLAFETPVRLIGRTARFRLPDEAPNAVVFRGDCELQVAWEKAGGAWGDLKVTVVSAMGAISLPMNKRLFDTSHPSPAHAGYTTLVKDSALSGATEADGGLGTARTSSAGDVVFVSRLPGSGAFTASTFLVADSEGPPDRVKSSLHAWSKGAIHSLHGWLRGMSGDPSAVVTASMTWRHGGENQRSGDMVGYALFDGFTTPVTFTGSLYQPPEGPALSVFGTPPPARISARLFGADLPEGTWSTGGTLDGSHTLSFFASQPGDPFKLNRLNFNPATGIFVGEGIRRIFDLKCSALQSTHPVKIAGVLVTSMQDESCMTKASGFYTYHTPISLPGTSTGRSQVVPLPQSGTIIMPPAGTGP